MILCFLFAIVAAHGSNEPAPAKLLFRVRRFLSRPLHEKSRSLYSRWRRLFAHAPFPIWLPFGAWFIGRGDLIGCTLSSDSFESAERAFAQSFLKPGMTVFDIGAHQGFHTLLASRCVGSSGRVFSFEPSPRERRALRLNLKINFCDNVAIQPVALGGEETTADLYVVDEFDTGCNSLRPPNVPESTSTVRVSVRTLDNWVTEQEIDRVDFIKLDAEGAELSVLKGASKSLARMRPVLLVEVAQIRTAAWGYDAVEIVRFLEEVGYEWFEILDGGKLAPLTQVDRQDMNLVAVPRRDG